MVLDSSYFFANIHKSSPFHIISIIFNTKNASSRVETEASFENNPLLSNSDIKNISVIMATVSPAQTTTQLLLSNTRPCKLLSTASQEKVLLLLQNNSKIPTTHHQRTNNIAVIDGHFRLKKQQKEFNEKIPMSEKQTTVQITIPVATATVAAYQPKRPIWTESYVYVRDYRMNSDNLKIVATESNMIRACKITRPFRSRRTFSPKRNDDFVWGKPSKLRNSTSACSLY